MQRSALNRHARQRAIERYGLHLNRELRRQLIACVQSGQTMFARRTSASRTVVVADVRGHGEVTFVYSKEHKNIVTFLPQDCAETAAWRATRSAPCTK